MADLTTIDALLILKHYELQSYKSAACVVVIGRARKVVLEAAEIAMQAQVGTLCTKCWGDGFHRPQPGWVRGPCEICKGTGNRAALQEAAR